jgi:hypothetical protein
MTALSAGELAISIKETKIAKRLRTGNQIFATRCKECRPQILGPLGEELEWCSAYRVAECQSGGVESLPRSRLLDQLRLTALGPGNPPAPATPVHRIPYDWVADVSQVDPDLMSASGMQLES